jgi:hypothetical protein
VNGRRLAWASFNNNQAPVVVGKVAVRLGRSIRLKVEVIKFINLDKA